MTNVSFLGFVFDSLAQDDIRRLAPPNLNLSFCPAQSGIPDNYLRDAEIIVAVAPLTSEMMAKAPRLRFIQKWGTGYDKIDIAAAAQSGIPVAITAGANADTIAEHAVMLILTILRSTVQADTALRRGEWDPAALRPISRRLTGKTVGIIGMGNIGRSVARMLGGFGTKVLYTNRRGPRADVGPAVYAEMDDLLSQSDIVSLHCPGGVENRGMIGAEALRKMKSSAYLINVARGELVDESALIAALQDGRLAGAGLDVFGREPLEPGSPLRELQNVVLTPHSAGSVREDVVLMARHTLGNIRRFLEESPISEADWVVSPSVVAEIRAKTQGHS